MKDKIYIHHYYTDKLYMKLFHNTKIIERIGDSFLVEYKDKRFRLIFDEHIHDNDDGLHILDYLTVHDQLDDPKFSTIQIDKDEEYQIIKRFTEITADREGWLLFILRGEKVIGKDIIPQTRFYTEIDKMIRNLSNHHIFCDNIILGEDTRGYHHLYYPFTNILFQWKNLVQLNIFAKFSQLYENMNYPFQMGYSVRNHKTFRNKLLNTLSSISNSKKLFLSRNTFYNSDKFYKRAEMIFQEKNNINKIDSQNLFDFEKNDAEITYLGNDLLFDVLSKSKMVILDESWVFKPYEYHAQYLSEKTFLLIMSKKPFLSTHSYPLHILDKILDIPKYPDIEKIKECQGDVKKLASYIEKFLTNFDENLKKHQNWINIVHDTVMNKVRNDNSLLDYIIEYQPTKIHQLKSPII